MGTFFKWTYRIGACCLWLALALSRPWGESILWSGPFVVMVAALDVGIWPEAEEGIETQQVGFADKAEL